MSIGIQFPAATAPALDTRRPDRPLPSSNSGRPTARRRVGPSPNPESENTEPDTGDLIDPCPPQIPAALKPRSRWRRTLSKSTSENTDCARDRTGTSGGSGTASESFHVSAPETRRRPKSEGWRGTVQRRVAARVSAGASAAFASRGLAALISFINQGRDTARKADLSMNVRSS